MLLARLTILGPAENAELKRKTRGLTVCGAFNELDAVWSKKQLEKMKAILEEKPPAKKSREWKYDVSRAGGRDRWA